MNILDKHAITEIYLWSSLIFLGLPKSWVYQNLEKSISFTWAPIWKTNATSYLMILSSPQDLLCITHWTFSFIKPWTFRFHENPHLLAQSSSLRLQVHHPLHFLQSYRLWSLNTFSLSCNLLFKLFCYHYHEFAQHLQLEFKSSFVLFLVYTQRNEHA